MKTRSRSPDGRRRRSRARKSSATELGGPLDAMEKAEHRGRHARAGARSRSRHLRRRARRGSRRHREDGRGISAIRSEFAHHLKLWFLAVLTAIAARAKPSARRLICPKSTSSSPSRPRRRRQGRRARDAEEQLDAIASMRPEVAASLLAVDARDPEMNDDVYVTLLKLYRESRPAEILAIGDAIGGMSDSERAAEDEFDRAPRSPGATRPWRSASRRCSRTAAPSSRSARCTFPARTAWSSGCAGMGYTVTKVW